MHLPGEDGEVVGCDGRGGVVLGGEDVARAPADVGTEGLEGLDEDGGLDGHVERAHDLGTLEGLRGAELGARRHQTGHLDLGELDFLGTKDSSRGKNLFWFFPLPCDQTRRG